MDARVKPAHDGISLRPGGKAQSGAGAGGRAIAGDILEPVQVEMLDRASLAERRPIMLPLARAVLGLA